MGGREGGQYILHFSVLDHRKKHPLFKTYLAAANTLSMTTPGSSFRTNIYSAGCSESPSHSDVLKHIK